MSDNTTTKEAVEAPETDETPETVDDTAKAPEAVTEQPDTKTVDTEAEQDEEPADKQFPKAYVDKLRKESAGYRDKAKDRDDLAHRVHTMLVEQTGKLADATDLPFSEDHLSDPDAMEAAIDDLLSRKAHLASRKPSGDIGQGVQSPDDSVSLAGILRSNAR